MTNPPTALLSTSAGSTMSVDSVLDFSNTITAAPNLYLGPNIRVVNDGTDGSFSSSLPINTSASISAYNLNIGVDSAASAQLTIDSDGNLTTSGTVTVFDKVTHKSTLDVDDLSTFKNGAKIINNLTVDNVDVSGSVDVSGNATIYGTLDVTGISTVQQLTVQQATTLNSTLSVVQAANLSDALIVAGKSTLNGGASISQGLKVDTIHASADIDTSGNMFSNTSYSTYSGSTNSNLVVNKKILDQVVENITGSNPATLEAIINLVKAFNEEDESILNAVLIKQNNNNNLLLQKIDYLYNYFFQQYSGTVNTSSSNTPPDAFIAPVVDISGNIILTNGTGGPGTVDTATVNASGTNGVTPNPTTTTTTSTTSTV